MILRIEWSYDSHTCDTCGSMWSQGAVVTLGGRRILDMPANAGCYDSVFVDHQTILEAVCAAYGIEIEEGDV